MSWVPPGNWVPEELPLFPPIPSFIGSADED